MSSANLVSLILVPETEYGVPPTPLSGVTAGQVRYTSESLSGTPTTTESEEIRTDRSSGGQVVVGSEIGGDITIELSKDPVYDTLIQSGMMNSWTAGSSNALTGVSVTMDPADDQKYTITDAGATFQTWNVAVGDVIVLSGFVDPDIAFNGAYKVAEVTDETTIVVWGKRALGDSSVGVTASFDQPDYVDIGAMVFSQVLAKAYQDVIHEDTDPDYHGQSYPGSLVSTMAFTATYGEIITAVFGTMANGYTQDVPAYEQAIATAGGTVSPPGTAQPLNATVDSGLVTVDGAATTFCIESLEITLDNNLTPQNCIGKIAPQKYNAGTAAVAVTMTMYNADSSYDAFMTKKWTQTPVTVTFEAVNDDGGYIFELAAVQLSFPDPASTGLNTQVMIDAAGTGKAGENGKSPLRIYRVAGAP